MGHLDFCDTEVILIEEHTTQVKVPEVCKEGQKCQTRNSTNAGWFSDKQFNKLLDPHAVSHTITLPMAKQKPVPQHPKAPVPPSTLLSEHPLFLPQSPLSQHPPSLNKKINMVRKKF